MKILAIGNSFSEDATFYLKKIAQSANVDCLVVNLYIGGCSLERHEQNIKEGTRAYRYEQNGVYTDTLASISETLQQEKWDIVTVQQVSNLSGVYESYGEHLQTVLACVRQHAPQAEIWFHETWAYENDSTHFAFGNYHNSQKEMESAIYATASRICQENGLQMIPCGEAVRQARQLPEFDYPNGGQSICRDGFHMSLVYGRYLLGLVWFQKLLKGKIQDVTFVPTKEDIINGFDSSNFSCNRQTLERIKDLVMLLEAA